MLDDKGNLYALIQQPERKFHEEDLTFPTQLKFYRKGKPFQIFSFAEKACCFVAYLFLIHIYSKLIPQATPLFQFLFVVYEAKYLL